MRKKLTSSNGIRFAALSAVAVLALSGCSEGNAAGDTDAPASGADVSAAQEAVDAAREVPTFQDPGPAFDAREAAGMSVMNIPLNSTVPFNQIIDDAMADAAEAAGVELIQYTNQGQVSQWLQGIESGIARSVDAIFLEGSPDPKLLGPQIEAANKAGIPVITGHLYDESDIEQMKQELSGIAAFVDAHHYAAGKLMADYAIVDSGGSVNALFISSNEVQPSAGIAQAFEDELTAQCPDTCKVSVNNIPISDWATKVPSQVQTALLKDPSINYVVPVFDGMTPQLVTGITQAGKTAGVNIVAYNGTASVMKMIQDEQLVVAEIGEPLEWIGWANMDQVLRVLTGTDPVQSENTPLRLFDASNIDEAGTPPTQTDGYGSPDEFKSRYLELWGLN